MKFSQRQGLTPIQKFIQLEELDNETRFRLWNVPNMNIIEQTRFISNGYYSTGYYNKTKYCDLTQFFITLWHDFFKLPVDNIPYEFDGTVSIIRKHFLEARWYIALDMIEFMSQTETLPTRINREILTTKLDTILKEENSAYRFLNGKLTPISDQIEVKEIESSLEKTFTLGSVKTHLETSIQLLSDRTNPDYRNSIKESISSVEAMCRILVQDESTTLGKALKTLEKKGKYSQVLLDAFSKLYGYTSGSSGIRHAILDESTCSFVDAKFMLVACSAFVNYLLGKKIEVEERLKNKEN